MRPAQALPGLEPHHIHASLEHGPEAVRREGERLDGRLDDVERVATSLKALWICGGK